MTSVTSLQGMQLQTVLSLISSDHCAIVFSTVNDMYCTESGSYLLIGNVLVLLLFVMSYRLLSGMLFNFVSVFMIVIMHS